LEAVSIHLISLTMLLFTEFALLSIYRMAGFEPVHFESTSWVVTAPSSSSRYTDGVSPATRPVKDDQHHLCQSDSSPSVLLHWLFILAFFVFPLWFWSSSAKGFLQYIFSGTVHTYAVIQATYPYRMPCHAVVLVSSNHFRSCYVVSLLSLSLCSSHRDYTSTWFYLWDLCRDETFMLFTQVLSTARISLGSAFCGVQR
jgi:hypothetical protein